jgi:hypothetical protein
MIKRTKPSTMKDKAIHDGGLYQIKEGRPFNPEIRRYADNEFLCGDCGVDTNQIGEIYWIKRKV